MVYGQQQEITRVVRAQKMFVVVPQEAMAASEKAAAMSKFTKTNETAKVLDYTCVKYTGEMNTRGVTTKVNYWTTTEISDPLKVLAHQPDPFGNPKLPEGVEGVPLKIENVMPDNTITLEATEVKNEKMNAQDFKIPADFKEMGK